MSAPAAFVPERATPADAVALSYIGRGTFTEKFGHLYTPENLNAFLDEAHGPDWYAYALSQPDVAVWVVRDGEELAGYAVAGPNTLPIDEANERAGEIKRLYVRERYQGHGLGARLQRAMLAWLEVRDYDPLYLGVWEDNDGAQKFYRRCGFSEVGEYIFPVGAHEDRELIFRRTVPPGSPVIERAKSSDHAIIRKAITAAFGQADEADLVDRLRADGDLLYEGVARSGDQVIGHVAMSRLPISFEDGDVDAAALAPVSVIPGWQGGSIGARLCEAAQHWWDANGSGVTVVLGHPDYYPPFGFSACAAREHLVCPFGDVGDAFMLRDLRSRLQGRSGGTPRYAAGFNLP